MENMELCNEFTKHKTDSIKVDLLYFDFTTSDEPIYLDTDGVETTSMAGPQWMVKSMMLTELKEVINFKKLAADFLNDNIKESVTFKPFHISGMSSDILENKFKTKNSFHSYYIATVGRLGKANTIVLNTATNEKYGNMIDGIKNVVINDFISDNTLYLLRNGDLVDPGYKFLFHTDNDGKFYYAITGVGFYPEKQASKFVIYE